MGNGLAYIIHKLKNLKIMTREEAIRIAEERNAKGFEGDSFIFKEIAEVCERFKINHIIETGTYKGWTTMKLAQLAPVYSVEINQENYLIAEKNLLETNGSRAKNNELPIKNIKFRLGNSVDALKNYLPTVKSKNILFFLDAHWYDYCPLIDELKTIAENKLSPCIVIHDFKVPGRDDLGYDRYKGQDFDLEWILPSLYDIYGNDFSFHYNSEAEGAKRGVIYIYPTSLND